ncbi:MAG: glycosyl transferase, partial [Bacilli bacterium]|nr:glycosyl transferase [Bacilli bacterium]
INTKDMALTGSEMRVFNIMLNYLYQTTRVSVTGDRQDFLRKNALGQSGLWKFGVSGDRPIILVEISDISDLSFIYEILKCFEYYKNNSIFVDVIIVNNEKEQFKKIINKEIEDELYRMYTVNSFYHIPGSVTVIDSNNITREDRSLLNMVPRLRFIIDGHKTLKECVEALQKSNTITDYHTYSLEENIEVPNKVKLVEDNGYGGFSKKGSEYLIYNQNTPQPWSNIISNNTFGTVVTNNGCGFTYAYNSGEFKLTSWTNDVISNDKSEGFRFNGLVFDPSTCVHGFGYSVLSSETLELKHEVTEFVPLNDNVKLYYMKLANKENFKKNIDVDYYLNPVLGNFEEKTSRHILSEFMGDDNFVKLRNVYSINYGDVNVFMSSNLKIDSAVTDKMLVKSITNKVELEPNEEIEIVYMLGTGMSDKECIEIINKYSSIDNVKKALKDVKDYWKKNLGVINVKSSDPLFDYMINGWYLYQTISSRIMAKTGFYQVSGAFGYRDQLQDAMNIAIVKPDYTRRQIIVNAAHQFREGDVLHWWHDKNRFGLRSRYKDDYLWLVYATVFYIKVTGDYSILDEKIPYILGDTLRDFENEKGIIFNYSNESVPLLEHLEKSLSLSMKSLGRHKIPLMGGGDWNDGMNKVGIKGKGESVWLGFFLYEIIDEFTSICKKKKIKIDYDNYADFNEKLKDNLNKKAWDKDWYLRAYFDNGDKLGSVDNSECKIDLISQSFSILSGVAPKDRIEKVIRSVEENLVDDKNKIIKLLTPPFKESLNNPGYIMNYPEGIRENGGQYTHSVAWYLMALIKSGYGDRAYRYYQMINPSTRATSPETVKKYKVEPYVIAADIYSAKSREGRGGWTWYTGSAGWFYKVGVMDILGLNKNGDILNLEPHIPVHWDNYRVSYNYMDTEYNIEVIKGNKDSLIVDGKVQDNNSIKLKNDKSSHEVTLYMKKK